MPILDEVMGLEALDEEVSQQDALLQLLEEQSPSELENWLNSPFWEAVTLIIQRQMKYNETSIIMGGVRDRTKDDPSAEYRSEDMLRGGLIAMRHMLGVPDELRQELEVARDFKNERQTGEGEE